MLLRDPATTLAEPLLAKLLLDPTPDLGAFWHGAGFAKLTIADVIREPA